MGRKNEDENYVAHKQSFDWHQNEDRKNIGSIDGE